MQEHSIRSFALDYYRKSGAEIRPLAGGEAFEIQPAAGAMLKVTFADGEEAAAMTATSPQWRAILEDLTEDVAVSYRYLVTGPIANPVKTLAEALPAGWTVTAARLAGVDHREALGFTHRVTFDSPALNACSEVIHHHLWDVADAVRLTAVEERFYELPNIMLKPERMPDETSVQVLLSRSLGDVDAQSEAKGRVIERDLAGLLAEAEKRTNQYFEQQMGNVLAREVAVSEKLDATIKKLGEARSPEAIAKLRAEGAALETQLEGLKARREQDLGSIEAACTAKLEQERDKHELTATTDLVALCHASYDVLTYRSVLTAPDGSAMTLELRYWPLTGELRFPTCAGCGGTSAPVATTGGGLACEACAVRCAGCDTAYAPGALTAETCELCQSGACPACAAPCVHCQVMACGVHTSGCATCEAAVCARCVKSCATCAEPLCQHHISFDPESGLAYCATHRPEGVLEAARPLPVVEMPMIQAEPAPEGAVPAAGEEETPAIAAWLTQPAVYEARNPLDPEAEALVDASVAALFARAPRVVSDVSGRTLHPAQAECCPACEAICAVTEMVDCHTCGVPACVDCISGEAGPCPACNSLTPAESDDERLGPVLAAFPKLRKPRRWEVAEVGPYLVAHWARHGTWGMVVLHVDAGDPPAVVTEFSYGRFETLTQTVSAWFGGGQ